jgi:TPP-dependent pyruvate/acetoin dehydrogenase alpha subunit
MKKAAAYPYFRDFKVLIVGNINIKDLTCGLQGNSRGDAEAQGMPENEREMIVVESAC